MFPDNWCNLVLETRSECFTLLGSRHTLLPMWYRVVRCCKWHDVAAAAIFNRPPTRQARPQLSSASPLADAMLSERSYPPQPPPSPLSSRGVATAGAFGGPGKCLSTVFHLACAHRIMLVAPLGRGCKRSTVTHPLHDACHCLFVSRCAVHGATARVRERGTPHPQHHMRRTHLCSQTAVVEANGGMR